MERIVRALGARGLVNAQFIVRDDGVYLIEVNPRASRTVPFMSKVTGVPMVELAVRIALGASLAELGWPGGLLPPPAFVAVKAPAFSTAKLRGVDPSVGPVHAVDRRGHRDPRPTRGSRMAKALRGAALVPPRPGRRTARRRSPCSRSPIATRRSLARLAAALVDGRLPVRRDAGDARRPSRPPGFDADAGREARRARRAPGEVPILDAHRRRAASGSSSTRRRRAPGAVRDAAEIRHAAIAEGVLCLTAIETAVAAAEALDPAVAGRLAEVRSLTDWVPRAARCAGSVPGGGAPRDPALVRTSG